MNHVRFFYFFFWDIDLNQPDTARNGLKFTERLVEQKKIVFIAYNIKKKLKF